MTIASDAPKTTVTIVATLAQQKDTTAIAVGLPGPSGPPAPASDTTPKDSSALRSRGAKPGFGSVRG